MKPFILKCDNEIILKEIEFSDSIDIFNTINTQREYLRQWLPFVDYTKELKDSEAFVNSIISLPEDQKEFTFVIKINDEFAGLIGFKSTDRANKRSEIGYWLSEPFQKKGIMTRAVKCLLDFGFNTLYLNRIQIKTAVGNIKSENIPLKLGLAFEGIEREGELQYNGEFSDIKVFSILKKEL